MDEQSVVLYCEQIPPGTNHGKLLQQFSLHGKVQKLYLQPDLRFAKIYYQTIAEANRAVQGLHKQPPLNLQIQLKIGTGVKSDNMVNHAPNKSANHSFNSSVGDFTPEYVDIFGRAITIVRTDDGIAVPLTELKKSGFELYERGTLPQPGQFRTIDEKIVDEFERHMRAETIKFVQQYKLSPVIKEDKINDGVDKCKNYLTSLLPSNQVGNHSTDSPVGKNTMFKAASQNRFSHGNSMSQPTNNTNTGTRSSFPMRSESTTTNHKEPLEAKTPMLRRPKVDIEDTHFVPGGVSAYDVHPKKSRTPSAAATNHTAKPLMSATNKLAIDENKTENIPVNESKPAESAINPNRLSPLLDSSKKCIIEREHKVGAFQFTEKINDEYFVAFCLPDECFQEIEELEALTTESKNQPGFKPKIGEVISAFYEDNEGYVRGLVLNTDSDGSCLVAFIDYGVVKSVSNIRPLPQKFAKYYEFACLLKVDKKHMSIMEESKDMMAYKLTSPSNFVTNGLDVEIALKAYRWDPFQTHAKSAGTTAAVGIAQTFTAPEPIYPENNETVILVEETDGVLMIRSRKQNEVFKQVQAKLEETKRSPMESLTEGQLVLCPRQGKGLFRAVIQSVQGQKATVRYLDYGQEDAVPLSEISNANESIASLESTLMEIHLKGFAKVKYTAKQRELIEGYITSREKFTTVEQPEKGVFDLKFSDGNSLSVKLISAKRLSLMHVNASPPKSTTTKTENDDRVRQIPLKNLTMGRQKVIVVYTGRLDEGHVVIWPGDEEVVEAAGTLNNTIAEYIAKDNTPYCPVEGEICLAYYSGDWHRAAVSSIENNLFTVYYLDYGNKDKVTSKDLRKLPRELAKLPILALTCDLQGLKKDSLGKVESRILDRLKELVLDEEFCEIDVVDHNDSKTCYHITLPEVYDVLKKERLI